jgi:thiol-disulfide isomerase/thioredoxin
MVRAAILWVSLLLALAASGLAWAQNKPAINERPQQTLSPLLGKPLPPLQGPATISRGLLNLQKYTRDVEFLKGEDGKLLYENGRPKARLTKYALVINFFATYCAPCIREIPTFNKIAASYDGQPVKFLYVNVDVEKSAEEVKAFAQEKGIAVEMMFPSVSQTVKEYQIDTLPRIVVADSEGVVRKVVLGFHDDLTAQLQKEIAMILKRGAAPAKAGG